MKVFPAARRVIVSFVIKILYHESAVASHSLNFIFTSKVVESKKLKSKGEKAFSQQMACHPFKVDKASTMVSGSVHENPRASMFNPSCLASIAILAASAALPFGSGERFI